MRRYILDLKSSWAKVKRAKIHIDTLAIAIGQESPKGKMLWVRRKYEPEQGAIVFRFERLVKIHDNWSLIIGDAVHNLRGALDHLAWQLAIRYFKGVEPTDKRIIKLVQFPIVEDKALWPNHANRKYMLVSDARKLKRFQPFKLTKKQATIGRHIFKDFFGFSGVSNVDKHRKIEVAHHHALSVTVHYNSAVDCVPANNATRFELIGTLHPPLQSMKPGDEILRIPVVSIGPNPDVDLEPDLAGCIAIRGSIDVVDALDKLWKSVVVVLRAFS